MFDMKKYIFDAVEDNINLLEINKLYYSKKIIAIVNILSKAAKRRNTIFWAGNGGSAADCQHMAAELVGRFEKERPAINSISLTTDTSALTAISNDYGYENVFARQLKANGKKNDILIVISTSGNSKNLIKALQVAKKLKINSVALLGNNGGKIKKYADISLVINSKKTPRIQEVQHIICHIICGLLEKKMGF